MAFAGSANTTFNGSTFNSVGRDMNIYTVSSQGKVGGGSTQGSFTNPSDKIWSIYSSESLAFDKDLAESWKGTMDGILIFAGLFSATISALIIESYKSLKPDPSETMVALLSQISSQLSAMANGTQSPPLLPPPDQIPFTPPRAAVLANIFWFLSLSLALTCAVAATLIQQWARDYLQAVQRRPSAVKRAMIRMYLYRGLKRFHVKSIVDAITTLLHISLFLFFIGLAYFLSPAAAAHLNRLVSGLLCLYGLLYMATTVLPSFWRDCPFRTPLSGVMWRLLQILRLPRVYLGDQAGNRRKLRIEGGLNKAREAMAMNQNLPGYDTRLFKELLWTIQSLTDDFEFEPFVEGIPGFLITPYGKRAITSLFYDPDAQLGSRIVRLFAATQHDTMLPPEWRKKRAANCMDALWAAAVNSVQFVGDANCSLHNLLPLMLSYITRQGDDAEVVAVRQSANYGIAVLLCQWPTFLQPGYDLSTEKSLITASQLLDDAQAAMKFLSEQNRFAGSTIHGDIIWTLQSMQNDPESWITAPFVHLEKLRVLHKKLRLLLLVNILSFQNISSNTEKFTETLRFFASSEWETLSAASEDGVYQRMLVDALQMTVRSISNGIDDAPVLPDEVFETLATLTARPAVWQAITTVTRYIDLHPKCEAAKKARADLNAFLSRPGQEDTASDSQFPHSSQDHTDTFPDNPFPPPQTAYNPPRAEEVPSGQHLAHTSEDDVQEVAPAVSPLQLTVGGEDPYQGNDSDPMEEQTTEYFSSQGLGSDVVGMQTVSRTSSRSTGHRMRGYDLPQSHS